MEEEKKIMMFGKSQSQIGNTNSHTTILTAGDVYIKTKNRYVPIFRNGKLNVDNSSEIFAIESVDAIKKTGIYLVTSTSDSGEQVQSVYLNVDGTKILLASSNDGYISYSTIQELKPEDFLLAAQNIGLYFNTIEEARTAGIAKGIVYILEEQKLYKVVNGEFVDMNAVESGQTSESEEQTDEEETDSLKIGCIFLDGTVGIIDSESKLVLQVDGTEYIKLLSNKIYPLKDIVLDQARQIYYQGGTQGESGFWVYTIDGESYLEIDNLIVHNASSSYSPQLYSTYIGSPSKSMIDSASWASAPTDIQLQLKYPESFEEGDHVVVFIGGGNQAKIGISQRASDSGVTEYYLTVALSAVPSQTTTLLVTCEYETDTVDDEGNTEIKTVQIAVTIDPNDMSAFVPDEGESADDDDDGATGNLYGEARAPVKIVNPLSIEVQSGDSDVFFINESGEQSGGSSLPTPMTGTVVSQSPLIINVPTQQSSADSILLNLKYSNIYKLVSQNSEQTVLVHEAENISLTKYTDEDGALSSSVTTRIGNLSSIADIENPEEFLEGHGIYTDNLVAVMPRFRGGTFVGDSEEDYPRYGANLAIPEEVDAEEYDNVIPTVGWVKALIEKLASPPSILP